MTAAAAETAACEFCGAARDLVQAGVIAACADEEQCLQRCRERAAAGGAG